MKKSRNKAIFLNIYKIYRKNLEYIYNIYIKYIE